MPVFADSESRSKIAMPVTSLPVPAVVGQAMCGFSGPGTGLPSPIGRVDVGEEVRGIAGVEIGGLARVDDRTATQRHVAIGPHLRANRAASANDASVGSTCTSV